MPDFNYIARNLEGQRITGSVAAATEREVISLLSGRSLFPIEVTSAKPGAARQRGRRVRPQTVATFYGQLSGLLRSGVPLLRSLELLKDQTSNAPLAAVLEKVHDDVQEGSALAEAMAKHPNAFREMGVNMIRAGGEGGFLEDALARVAKFTEQQEDLKSETMGALAYPIFLAVFGTAVVTFLLVFFVPSFEEMFTRLREKGELPWITDALLNFSGGLQKWGFVWVGAIVFVLLAIRAQLATERGKYIRDRIKLKLPLAGKILESLAVARFCRVLGTMLHNGVPILKSLDISREAAGNKVLSEAVSKATENVSSGESLAAPLAKSGHFPREVVEMISVAEESNTLDEVLIDISDGLERRTARNLTLMVRLLEPIMLLVMAALVLLVVMALLLPVMKMSSTLG